MLPELFRRRRQARCVHNWGPWITRRAGGFIGSWADRTCAACGEVESRENW